MATVHPSIDDALARWILQQHVFFVWSSLTGLPAVEAQ